jgi:hypothetical protein
MNLPPQKVSKLEAAGRQLRQAIHIFLSDGDMISVHTLATASLQVLADIGIKAGVESMVKNPQSIRPEKRKYVANLMNEPQNFFKHADRDPDGVLEFYPDSTPFYVIDAVLLHQKLSGTTMPACKAFHVWFSLNYPDVLVDAPYKDFVQNAVSKDPSLVESGVALRLLLLLEQNGA